MLTSLEAANNMYADICINTNENLLKNVKKMHKLELLYHPFVAAHEKEKRHSQLIPKLKTHSR